MLTLDQKILEANLRVGLFIARSCLAAKEQLGLLSNSIDDDSIEDYLEVQAAEYFLNEAEERHCRENYEREELQWRETHSWLDALERKYPTQCQVRPAAYAVRDYISASRDREYSYDCNVNPEGISDDSLDELEDEARNLMMAALSTLTDGQIEDVLASNQNHEHDGSRYPVAEIADVRDWQDEQTQQGNVIATRE